MSQQNSVELQIRNLSCQDCSAKVEKGVLALPGVDQVLIDLTSGKMSARIDPSQTDSSGLVAKVSELGYDSYPIGSKEKPAGTWTLYRLHILTGASGALWVLATALFYAEVSQMAVRTIYLAGILAALWGIGRQILSSVKQLSLDMNILMTAAVIGAIALGEWTEGAMVIFLFALAQLIESYSLHRANRAIESLMDLSPDTVTLLDGINEETVSPEVVPVGSRILVRPGERIGLDGEVQSGRSAVNQATVTGEALPVDKAPGDEVFAGTINGEGALVVRTTHPASDSTVARIIALVRDAKNAQAPSQRFIDAFTKIYTPIVFAGAIAFTLVPVLAFGLPFSVWFYRSLVILLVACPCAFVIATPVTIVSGLAAAARSGLLIKGGLAMEKAARIRAVAFDKTGTLTEGKPRVVKVIGTNSIREKTLLGLAASVEQHSGHILGEAIADYARELDCEIPTATDVRALPGLGAVGTVDGREIFVGSHRFFHDEDLCSDELHRAATGLEGTAKTLVFVASKREPKGVIVLSDAIRENGREAMDALRKAGIEHLTMLTGDNPVEAKVVADRLGLDEVRAELMPEQKVEALAALRERFGAVAMVGDGINDAPALAASDFGIAMGAGSDQALETADAALISGQLTRLAPLLSLARTTLSRVKTNTAIALGIKGLFLVLAVGGWATLWMAVFADMGASLIVIANGVRLLRARIL